MLPHLKNKKVIIEAFYLKQRNRYLKYKTLLKKI